MMGKPRTPGWFNPGWAAFAFRPRIFALHIGLT